MSKAARANVKRRRQRRARLGRKFSIAEQIFNDHSFARMILDTAPLTRVLIEQGLAPVPDCGLENHDAVIRLIEDGLGLATLTDAEFESAIRLATPPEFRETVH